MQIRRNSPFAFDDRGEQSFRNIVQPVHIYRLRGEITSHVYQIAPTQPTPMQAKRPYSPAVMPIEVASGNEPEVLGRVRHRGADFRTRSIQETVRHFTLGLAVPRGRQTRQTMTTAGSAREVEAGLGSSVSRASRIRRRWPPEQSGHNVHPDRIAIFQTARGRVCWI
jgi:hypothetical protein